MKYLRFFIILLLIPLMVLAEECDIDKLSISSITAIDKSGNAKEIDEATIDDKDINLNISMSEVGDNIKYRIVLKNESNEDYELDKKSLNIQSDYINYTFEYEDELNIIEAKSNKTLFLKVEYTNEVPDAIIDSGSITDNKNLSLQLTTNDTINILDTIINPNTNNNQKAIENPNTGNYYIHLVIIVLIVSVILFIILRKEKYTKYMILIIAITIIIPISVYALCKCDINIISNIRIEKEKAIEPIYLYGRANGVDIGDSVEVTETDNQAYIEHFGNIIYSIGDYILIPDEDMSFDMMDIFFKYKIENNIVTGIGIEYKLNNKRYSLIYDPSYFESNKQVLNNSFVEIYGDNKCHLVNENHYYCYDSIGGNMTGSASSDGSISFELNSFGCSMNKYKTNCSFS